MSLHDEVREWLADAAAVAGRVTKDPRVAEGAALFGERIRTAGVRDVEPRMLEVTQTAPKPRFAKAKNEFVRQSLMPVSNFR